MNNAGKCRQLIQMQSPTSGCCSDWQHHVVTFTYCPRPLFTGKCCTKSTETEVCGLRLWILWQGSALPRYYCKMAAFWLALIWQLTKWIKLHAHWLVCAAFLSLFLLIKPLMCSRLLPDVMPAMPVWCVVHCSQASSISTLCLL